MCSVYLWNEVGARTTDATKGQRYLLSTMLGVTYGRGNSVSEVLSYLKRAAAADGTRPKGTIYFMKNNDPRSTPRDACFDGIARDINKLGVRAVVKVGTIPQGAADVMGLMAGVKEFDWSKSGSTILPGAICEHLTSYGGDMSPDAVIVTRAGLREAWETASVERASQITSARYDKALFEGDNIKIGLAAFAGKKKPEWLPSKI